MVDRLDRNVGRVVETLRESGELDNTVIALPVRQRRRRRLGAVARLRQAGRNGRQQPRQPRRRRQLRRLRPRLGAGGDGAVVALQGLRERGRHPQRRLHRRPGRRADGRRRRVPLRRRRDADGPRARGASGRGHRRRPHGRADPRPELGRLSRRHQRRGLWARGQLRLGALRVAGAQAGRLEARRHRRRQLAAVRPRDRSGRDARPQPTDPERAAALAAAWEDYAAEVGVILPETVTN